MKIFCPLASGSKGNAIFFKTNKTSLLIDAGLSAKALQERLKQIDQDIANIDAIIISHEHGDHIRGLDVLAGKMGIEIFANADTAKVLKSSLKYTPKFRIFSTGETFQYKDVHVHPFSVQHDTIDPVAFTIICDNVKFGICTDLGFVSSLVNVHLKHCDYLYIESNHDEDLVHSSSRPMLYKQRVLSRQGHLSNKACAKLLSDIYHEKLQHVYLAHLSNDCNSEEIALNTINQLLDEKGIKLKMEIAKQDKISTPIYF